MTAVNELRSHGESLGSDEPSAEFLATEERMNAEITALEGRISRGLDELEARAADAELEARMAALPVADAAPASDDTPADVAALRSFIAGERGAVEFMPTEQRDLLAGTATDGAELVPTSLHSKLVDLVDDYSNVAGAVQQLVTASGNPIDIPTVTALGSYAVEGEADTIAEADPQFSTVSLSAFKLARLTQVSSELLQDSVFDVESFVVNAAARALAIGIDSKVVVGAGTTEPEGIMTAANLTESDFAGGTAITANELIDVFHALGPQYRSNASWILRDSTVAYIRKLTNAGTVDYVWQPGLQAGQPDLLLGKPVIVSPDAPAIALNAITVAFGDWKQAYALRMAGGVRFARSDDFAFANDLSTFRASVRIDGKVIDGSAYVTRAQAAA